MAKVGAQMTYIEYFNHRHEKYLNIRTTLCHKMELSSTFKSHGWIIKYGLHEPQKLSGAHLRTVVFVHGTPWSSEVFQPIAKALLSRGQYRILLYDLPGYGQSQVRFKPDETTKQNSQFQGDTSVKTQGAVLAELLKHLELDGTEGSEAPHVIAHDIAGTIALRTHLIHQCNFQSLMLLDTNCVLPWGDGFYKLVRSKPNVFLELPTGIFDGMLRGVIKSACHNPNVLKPGWEDIIAQPWIIGPGEDSPAAAEKQRSFVRQIAQANDADVAEMLDVDYYSRVRCDVKILWGKQDQWIPREKMESLSEKLRNRLKEFVVVPDAGHLVMLDQPEMVAIEVFEWLSKQQ
jgi:pimeloyl-ACP methyl ester carboxylesterase